MSHCSYICSCVFVVTCVFFEGLCLCLFMCLCVYNVELTRRCVSSSLCVVVYVSSCVYAHVCVCMYGVSLCVCENVCPCQSMCLSLWLKLFLDSMRCAAVPFLVGLVVVSFMTPSAHCEKSKFFVLWEEYGRCVET